MTLEWTFARLAAAFVLACAGACSGDEPGDDDGPAFPDAAAAADASLSDAAVVDCTGDHRESADGSNNPLDENGGSAEATGLSLAAGQANGFTICGQIDPRHASDRVADYDGFEFTVTGDEPVNLRIELVATPGDYGGIWVELLRAEGIGVWLAAGPFRNGYAMVAGKTVEPGTYWVSTAGRLPAPAEPIGYAISVRENALSCPRADRGPDYLESIDGADSRGNDTISVNHANPPPVLTETRSDAPEVTGLVLDPEAVGVLAGVSDDVKSTDGDSYLDRDAYVVSTGPGTTELELRLSWPDGDVDLDVYLFEADHPESDYSSRLGIQTSSVVDELLTLNVDPGKSYWLWIAAFDDTMQGGSADLPLSYDVTLCPREHVPLLPLP